MSDRLVIWQPSSDTVVYLPEGAHAVEFGKAKQDGDEWVIPVTFKVPVEMPRRVHYLITGIGEGPHD